MGPKAQRKSPNRSKSPKKAEGGDTAFLSAQISDDNWQAIIAFVVPSKVYDELYIEQLEKATKTGKRRRFTWISRKDLIEQATEQTSSKGGAAAKKGAANSDRLTPGIIGHMEALKPYIDNKEEIPDNLIMKLLKAKLLHIKTVKMEEKLNQGTPKDKSKPAAGGKDKKDNKSPSGKKTPVKGKKGAPGPLPDIDKPSQLRKRDEIEEEEKYIDDEPTDGPDHYFILSGFYAPTMFSNAEELNLPIDGIIKFKSSNYHRIQEFIKEIDEREKLETNLKSNLKITTDDANKDKKVDVLALSEERQAQMQKTAVELEKFWKDISIILENSADKSMLQNIARLKYNVTKEPNVKSWFEIEAREEFAGKMFDDVSEKLFGLVIQKRQFKNYLNNLRLFSIPQSLPAYVATNLNAAPQFNLGTSGDSSQLDPNLTTTSEVDKSNVFDMRYYNELLDSVAPESISPAIILHSMLEQIVATEEKKQLPSEIKSNSVINLVQNLSADVSKHFSDLISSLAVSHKEKEELSRLIPPVKKQSKPVENTNPYLINYHDDIHSRLKGVYSPNNNSSMYKENKDDKPIYDPIDVENIMLNRSPLTVFTGLPNVPPNLAKERAARLHELLNFCITPEITHADVDRCFKQFIFESMNLASTDERNYVVKSNEHKVIPWDDPYPNINSTLTQEKQIQIKALNLAESRATSPKKKYADRNSAGTSSAKSIKFQDEVQQNTTDNNSSWGRSSMLKSRPSTKMSVQSVHFDDDDFTNQIETVPTRSMDQVITMINNSKRRNLSEWNFAEHFEPKIFVQVLQKALLTHPYVNTYYCRRDHSLMLVMSNPFNRKTLCNNEKFSVKLHSNVGFRNYLERIYDMIIGWTRDEEAKYQAMLTSKEVSSFSLEDETRKSRPSSKSTKSKEVKEKDRPSSKSDKTKKSKEEPAAAATDEQPYITDTFVGGDSLKAWKKEHEKQVAETQQRKIKSPKSSKDKDTKAKSRSRSKSSSGSNSPRSPNRVQSPKTKKTTPRSGSKTKTEIIEVPEKKEPKDNSFVGYDVGNNMIYLKTHLNHMFPCDGSLIKTEKIEQKTGSRTFITSSLLRSGHVFSVHIVDPKKGKIDESKQDDDYQQVDVIEGHIKGPAKDAVALHSENKTQNTKQDSDKSKGAKESNKQQQPPPKVEDEGPVLAESTPYPPSPSKVEDCNNIAKYGCFTGSFRDGFNISFSVYDLRPVIKIDTANIQTVPPPPVEPTPVLPPTADDKTKKTPKKNKKDVEPEPIIETVVENPVVVPEIKEPPKVFKVLPWSQLYASTPIGLCCTFIPELYSGIAPTADNEPHKVLVKQYYSVKCHPTIGNVKYNNLNIYKERSRTIKSDGTVIKYLNDETIEVLYPNGTIYRKEFEPKLEQIPDMDTSDLELPKEKKSTKKKDQKAEELSTPRTEVKPKSKWVLITATGNKYELKPDKTFEYAGYYRNITAHDPQTEEVMISREDQLRIINRPNHSTIAHFPDGTRITSYFVRDQLSINDSETGEISIEGNPKLTKYYKIECHGFATTIFNSETTSCSLVFGNGTKIACNPQNCSYEVQYHDQDKLDINCDGSVVYTGKTYAEENKDINSNKFFFNQNSDIILDHTDDNGNIFKVNKFGTTESLPAETSDESVLNDSFLEYHKHSPRFFVIHKDSSGTELLRFQDILDYMKEVENDPMTAIMRDGIQDNPNMMGTTVLRPLKDSYGDNWICQYDEQDITPYGLRCRNLSNFPSNPEIKVPGPKFGSKLGRGLEIEVNQAQKVKNTQLQIPRRMEYRQLIEYDKLSDETRGTLLEGLKNYMSYVVERAEKHRLLLGYDPRTEAEKLTALKILKLARPNGLLDYDVAMLYRKNVSLNLSDNDSKETINRPPSNALKKKSKALETLLQEINKEKINKQAWKQAYVPPYFESMWGKAFIKSEIEKENKEPVRSDHYAETQSTSSRDRYIGKTYEDPNFKKPLPPIVSKTNETNTTSKSDEIIQEKYIYPKPKANEKLNSLKVPNSLKTARPNALPNATFLVNEDPVRRRVQNSIVKASIINGKSLEKRRGCEIFPNEINFGILREGITYAFDLELLNVGIDACRFKIKQIPPETGLKVQFKPGPLASGMTRDITVTILPVYRFSTDGVEQVYPTLLKLREYLEITTEIDVLRVPIEAEIATSDEFRKLFRGNLEAGKNSRVRIISVQPGSTRELVTKLSDSISSEVK